MGEVEEEGVLISLRPAQEEEAEEAEAGEVVEVGLLPERATMARWTLEKVERKISLQAD